MIITVGGIKGGSGKTTIATNLACIGAGQGLDILLVDTDDQETSYDFTMARKEDQPNAPTYTCIKLTGNGVHTEVLALTRKHDHIIIDAGGRDSISQRAALVASNMLLIPCKPRSFDLWSIKAVSKIVDEARIINPKLEAFVFLNQTDPEGQGTENMDTIEELRKEASLTYLDCPLGNRKAFAHAASLGLSVTELVRPHRNPKAIEEIMVLFQRCFNVTLTLNQPQEAIAG